jgi:pilus assembly protein CpaB
MRANVVVMLALAVVFGVAAVFLSNIWLANQEPRAAMIGPGEHAEQTVVVAAGPLRFGDKLTADNLREIPWTAGALPAGSFSSRAQLLDPKAGDRQVLVALAANEPILGSKITGPGQRATLSAVLDPGMKAVSIRVNDIAGVAGFVLPGDRVDVLLTRRDGAQSTVDVLLQSVKVLAIDQIADDKKENPTVARSVTVEVSTLDAQKLTLAAGVGELALALRQVGSSRDEVTDHVTLGDLTGDQPAAEAPKPEQVAAAAPSVAPVVHSPATVQVDVYRGTELKSYDVPVVSLR